MFFFEDLLVDFGLLIPANVGVLLDLSMVWKDFSILSCDEILFPPTGGGFFGFFQVPLTTDDEPTVWLHEDVIFPFLIKGKLSWNILEMSRVFPICLVVVMTGICYLRELLGLLEVAQELMKKGTLVKMFIVNMKVNVDGAGNPSLYKDAPDLWLVREQSIKADEHHMFDDLPTRAGIVTGLMSSNMSQGCVSYVFTTLFLLDMEGNINGKDMDGSSDWATKGGIPGDGSSGDVKDFISLNGMLVSQILIVEVLVNGLIANIQETQTVDYLCLGDSWASRIIVRVAEFGVNFSFKGKTLSSFILAVDNGYDHQMLNDLYMTIALGIFSDASGLWMIGWFGMIGWFVKLMVLLLNVIALSQSNFTLSRMRLCFVSVKQKGVEGAKLCVLCMDFVMVAKYDMWSPVIDMGRLSDKRTQGKCLLISTPLQMVSCQNEKDLPCLMREKTRLFYCVFHQLCGDSQWRVEVSIVRLPNRWEVVMTSRNSKVLLGLPTVVAIQWLSLLLDCGKMVMQWKVWSFCYVFKSWFNPIYSGNRWCALLGGIVMISWEWVDTSKDGRFVCPGKILERKWLECLHKNVDMGWAFPAMEFFRRDTKVGDEVSALVCHVRLGIQVNWFFMLLTSLNDGLMANGVVGHENGVWKVGSLHLLALRKSNVAVGKADEEAEASSYTFYG